MDKKKHRVAKAMGIMLLVATLFAFTGCGDENDDQTAGGDASGGGSAQSTMYDVELMYGSAEYINTGNEALEKLVEIEGAVGLSGDADSSNDDVLRSNIAIAAIEELAKQPEESTGAVTCVMEGVVNSTEVKGDTCTIDLNGEMAYSMDSYTEQFCIYQLAGTVLESVEDVEKVQFTVDGAKVDGLSHMDLAEAYTDDEIEMFSEPAGSES